MPVDRSGMIVASNTDFLDTWEVSWASPRPSILPTVSGWEATRPGAACGLGTDIIENMKSWEFPLWHSRNKSDLGMMRLRV